MSDLSGIMRAEPGSEIACHAIIVAAARRATQYINVMHAGAFNTDFIKKQKTGANAGLLHWVACHPKLGSLNVPLR
jgi:hypothetical protein